VTQGPASDLLNQTLEVGSGGARLSGVLGYPASDTFSTELGARPVHSNSAPSWGAVLSFEQPPDLLNQTPEGAGSGGTRLSGVLGYPVSDTLSTAELGARPVQQNSASPWGAVLPHASDSTSLTSTSLSLSPLSDVVGAHLGDEL
jgi:hypothetical protein